jgi:hypothetical protein
VFTYWGYDADLDLQLDNASPARIWILACGGGSGRDNTGGIAQNLQNSFRQMVINTPIQTNVVQQVVHVLEQVGPPAATINNANACFQEVNDLNPDLGESTICDTAGCNSFDVDVLGSTVSTSVLYNVWDSDQFAEADYKDGWRIFAQAANGALIDDGSTSYSLMTDVSVQSIDIAWVNNTLFAGAVVTEAGGPPKVILEYGTPPAMTRVDFPLVDNDPGYNHDPYTLGCNPSDPGCTFGRNLEPYKISVYADNDDDNGDGVADGRLVMAVAARSLDAATEPSVPVTGPLPQDAVGWVFLGFSTDPQ